VGIVWKFCLALYLQNLWFTSIKKLATFGYVVGVFFTWKFKLFFLRILNWSANESKTLSLSYQSRNGRGVAGIVLESQDRRAGGRFQGEGVRCLADVQVRKAKTEACDLKKIFINKAVIIKKEEI
jgi:hypothetical protein